MQICPIKIIFCIYKIQWKCPKSVRFCFELRTLSVINILYSNLTETPSFPHRNLIANCFYRYYRCYYWFSIILFVRRGKKRFHFRLSPRLSHKRNKKVTNVFLNAFVSKQALMICIEKTKNSMSSKISDLRQAQMCNVLEKERNNLDFRWKSPLALTYQLSRSFPFPSSILLILFTCPPHWLLRLVIRKRQSKDIYNPITWRSCNYFINSPPDQPKQFYLSSTGDQI